MKVILVILSLYLTFTFTYGDQSTSGGEAGDGGIGIGTSKDSQIITINVNGANKGGSSSKDLNCQARGGHCKAWGTGFCREEGRVALQWNSGCTCKDGICEECCQHTPMP